MRKERELSESLRGKRIAWLIPGINRGSGGLQTIFRHASHLHSKGAVCDFHIIPGGLIQTEEEATELLVNEYDCPGCRVFPLMQLDSSYDAVVATMWTSVKFAVDANISHKFYFVQDFEPWFYPMGDDYLEAEMTYHRDIIPITIGNWLAAKLENECGTHAYVTDFCADSSIYRNLNTPREHALCVIFQPEKPRRCVRLVLDALELLSIADPTLKIYAFGSTQTDPRLSSFAENLGMLSKIECNELYNKCEVGLTISTSNPSRIPFEMMAAGLPVVDVYRENNLYDFDDNSILLARSSPEGIASAILEVSCNSTKQEVMRTHGAKIMSARPIDREMEQFAEHIEHALNSTQDPLPQRISKSYHQAPGDVPEKMAELNQKLINRQISSLACERKGRLEAPPESVCQPQNHGILYRVLRRMKRTLSHL